MIVSYGAECLLAAMVGWDSPEGHPLAVAFLDGSYEYSPRLLELVKEGFAVIIQDPLCDAISVIEPTTDGLIYLEKLYGHLGDLK